MTTIIPRALYDRLMSGMPRQPPGDDQVHVVHFCNASGEPPTIDLENLLGRRAMADVVRRLNRSR